MKVWMEKEERGGESGERRREDFLWVWEIERRKERVVG